MRKTVFRAVACVGVMLSLAACGNGSGDASAPNTTSGATTGSTSSSDASTLSLAAQAGQKLFFDSNLSGNKNMACATCHDPAYAYGPPNSLSVQLGSDPTQSGARAVPSLRYKDATPPYNDVAANPDNVTSNAPGGGFMWDGRAATLADQVAMPLLNPVEMNSSKTAVVQAVQNASYVDLFKQAFGADVFSNPDAAFADVGKAIEAYEHEDTSFHPYTSKYDLYVHNKIGGTLTAAETRGLLIFNSGTIGNCSACHYAGANFDGNQGLMTDFTYQAIGLPRNDTSIPNNPSPIPANQDPTYYDMGLCGPLRTDHQPGTAGIATPDPYCGMFKVPTLRNVATRGAFFHNGVLHSLVQVVHFYNTRDTNPEYWYPATGGTGAPIANPSYALFPQYASGATVQKFNDLPAAFQGNVDEELPMGTGDGGSNTLGSGTQPRAQGSTPIMTEHDMQDLICFLNILSDGYKPPPTQPTSGTCVN
ncbi:cytochrome c peroxidase [Paraburkholderia youngii]|uniref:cytochrome-c peroxidase n=1 Tax=Paraburkholderia youngii TaxID=2782701 RepID=UPI003D1BD7F9